MLDINPELNTLQTILEDIQAIDINIIDIKKHTTITDYMVVCSGRSSRHVRAIAEYTMEHMKSAGIPPVNSTGIQNGEWALIDFGDCILHVFQPDIRDFYNLEGLWQGNQS